MIKNKKKNLNTVWIGDLDGFEDRGYFDMICTPLFHPVDVKIMKDKTNRSSYAFIVFEDTRSAEAFIAKFKDQQRPLSKK